MEPGGLQVPCAPLLCFVCVANMGKADGSDTVDLRAGGRTEEKPRHPEPLLESRPPRPPAPPALSQDAVQLCFLPAARTPIPGPGGAIPGATVARVLSHTRTHTLQMGLKGLPPAALCDPCTAAGEPVSKLTDPLHVITLPSARGSASGCNLLSTDLNVPFAQRSGMGR